MKKILSIDGGGIRGIIPAMVLNKIEKETGQEIAEIFDLIAGTSTGGLLALGLIKDGGGGKQDQYTAEALVNIYKDRGNDIFGREFRRETSDLETLIISVENIISWLHNIPLMRDQVAKHVASLEKLVLAVRGMKDEIYSHDGLVNVLNCYFGEATLGNLRQDTDVMVTCYDIEARSPVFLKSWYPTHQSVRMQDAARATSAAPTYFEPASLQIGDKERALIDGGIFINSPAVSAYAEARSMFPDEKDFFVLSLGTGTFTKRFQGEIATNWGKVEWLHPLMDCIFDGMQEAADYQMRKFLPERNYFRLTGDLSKDNDRMDNVDASNIESLEAVAAGIIQSNDFGKFLKRFKQLIESDSLA